MERLLLMLLALLAIVIALSFVYHMGAGQ